MSSTSDIIFKKDYKPKCVFCLYDAKKSDLGKCIDCNTPALYCDKCFVVHKCFHLYNGNSTDLNSIGERNDELQMKLIYEMRRMEENYKNSQTGIF